MTTFCLEMRSTANWDDIRYREYTTSKRKADLFRQVPKIRFTDSGHHIIAVVREHSGPRLPRNMMLQDHVVDAIVALNKVRPTKADAFNDMLAALKNVQKIISEGAMTGFNCHDGDWAERLFTSQQVTSAAIKKATQ